MIQRIQTLYLLLSGLLMLIPLFLPVLAVVVPDLGAVYRMGSVGMESPDGSRSILYSTWALFGLNILIPILSFVGIFLYNKRGLQMRVTMFNLILKAGFYALLAFYVLQFQGSLDAVSEISIRPWVAVPLVCMILDYLAHRGIAIDDRTIRYMDRLR